MEIDSLTTRSKTRPSLLALLITQIQRVVAEEGVPYQRTIDRKKIRIPVWGGECFFRKGLENRREKNILANPNSSIYDYNSLTEKNILLPE